MILIFVYVNPGPIPELSLGSLYKELETLTDPIKLGVGLGVAEHHLEIIRKNHPQGLLLLQ